MLSGVHPGIQVVPSGVWAIRKEHKSMGVLCIWQADKI